MLALVVDFSAHPQAKWYKCYNVSMPHTQDGALSPNSSLRLKHLAQARGSLAQASSLRLGESSTHMNSGLCAFSLRRDSPRLSETLARSNLSWSPE
ncbi:hypothetical protein DEO72_LG5g1448 [Vigna unguiculata]|uniref:Uncharacterized protein n=1 Tax=Vigna unguiculata TaxID=3917 RepID=A0A4D6LY06_VIGUN|nr:hypothetical protein DEO72_LG5g1448 [Vigna unguiculata]